MLTDCPPVTFVLTPDIDRARTFYSETLGLTQTSEDDFAVTYDLAGTMLRLTKVQGWKSHLHTVLGWLVADVAAKVAELRSRGVEFAIYEGLGQDSDGIWSAPGGGPKIAWFHDPDGNNLSLTQF